MYISFMNFEKAKSIEISPWSQYMYNIFSTNNIYLAQSTLNQCFMYVNMQCNIIVQAYFMEACYNRVRDWWFGPLLHDTDQPREMLTTDQSPRDLRSLRLWSVLSISLSWSVSCNSDHITSLTPLNIEYCNMYIDGELTRVHFNLF